MPHSQDLESDEAPGEDLPQAVFKMSDRSFPNWALFVGGAFTISIALCMFSLLVLTFLFDTLVAQGGESRMAPALLAIALTVLAGIWALEWAHTRALRGYRWLREENGLRINAVLAMPATLLLFFVHPLAGMVAPLGILVGGFGLRMLARRQHNEAPWAYLPTEALSLMAGRDAKGVGKAQARSDAHALADGMRRFSVVLALIVSVAANAFLISENILMPGASLAFALLSAWNVECVLRFLQMRWSQQRDAALTDNLVHKIAPPETDPTAGLAIHHLNVVSHGGRVLMNDVTLDVAPGEIVGIVGDSGAGKSLLLKTLADPFSISGARVSGSVHLAGADMWERQAKSQPAPLFLVPDPPIILPASGGENLSCFQGEDALQRGRYFLEQMVFAHDLVNDICRADDARKLPSMQRKALALSRAFAVGPSLYLLDRPEDGLQAPQISALCNRLNHEARLGRCILLVSDNRALMEKCDRLFVIQNGAVIDFGPAEQVRKRRASGWHRFIGSRGLETEQNLEDWVRSHFRRNGDEANRRKACLVASELLALSCRDAGQDKGQTQGGGEVRGTANTIEFLLKNFEGYCALHVIDDSAPLSSGQIQLAKEQIAQNDPQSRRNPLATVLDNTLEADFDSHQDGRITRVKIETYDPRKGPVNHQGSKQTSNTTPSQGTDAPD